MPSHSPRTAARNCDEYPMATTHQGALYVAANDTSSRMVTDTANDSQGGRMSYAYAYVSLRLIENDEFLVLAVLSDGRTSW